MTLTTRLRFIGPEHKNFLSQAPARRDFFVLFILVEHITEVAVVGCGGGEAERGRLVAL